MKKLLLILLLLILCGCAPKKSLQDLLDEITLPQEVANNLELPNTYQLNGETVEAIWNTSNPNIITQDGIVTRDFENKDVTLSLTLIYKDQFLNKDFPITVLAISREEFLSLAITSLSIPEETKDDLILPPSIMYQGKKVTTTWVSNSFFLTNDGKVGLVPDDTIVELTVTAAINNVSINKTYTIKLLALSKKEQAEYVFNNLTLPENIAQDIELPTSFEFNITGTWESNKPHVLLPDGKIASGFNGQEKVKLTLTLNTNDRREFIVTVSTTNNHLIIDRTFDGEKENLTLDDNGKLVLSENALEGAYTSQVINTLPFTEAVASWVATSSEDATCELFIKVLVDGTWSKFFSYGKWGLGLENKSSNQSDAIARLSVDELLISNSKKAEALQFKIILRRTKLTIDSPKVTLLAAALNIPNYSYNVNIDNISKTRDYDVPKLNQNDVPEIGNIICSPTSATMLLKFKGHDFSEYDSEYEHRYIARLFRDHGYGYGNWVYNTVGMSAFGEVSYVMRMYSYQELLYHLDNVGPIAASIKGTVIGEIGDSWNTNGHLIVVRGYRIENDQIYILANDPNMKNVYEEYKLQNFLNVWRNIAYIIE